MDGNFGLNLFTFAQHTINHLGSAVSDQSNEIGKPRVIIESFERSEHKEGVHLDQYILKHTQAIHIPFATTVCIYRSLYTENLHPFIVHCKMGFIHVCNSKNYVGQLGYYIAQDICLCG